MFKIAVVEDDAADSEALLRFLSRYAQENHEDFKISVFKDGLEFLGNGEPSFQIIFMDIMMPHLDGIKTARKLRTVDQDASLIFVTNMVKYAVSGYEVDAMDFVVKPVDYFNFALKLEKAIRIQKKKESQTIILPSEDGMVKVNLNRILYIESSLHFVVYHIEDGDLRVRASMKDTEKKFEGMDFLKCNNSFLINLAAIDKVVGDDVIIGEHRIPISRGKRKEFLNGLAIYYGGIE